MFLYVVIVRILGGSMVGL